MKSLRRRGVPKGRPKKNTLNYHLSVLGLHNIAYAKKRKFKATVRERYQSIYDRLEDYQIYDYAMVAYKQRMLECHPDRGGDPEDAKKYGESWNWIKQHMKRRMGHDSYR